MTTTSDQQMPGWLYHAIQNDPAFRVLTMDGVNWIDPFTGTIVAAPFGYEDVAHKYLAKHKPWTRMQPKQLTDLLILRWFHYLRENLEFVPYLRVFNHGMWLNPYIGQWISGIPLENDKVTLRSIEAMATHLAHCGEAQTGKMIETYKLDRLIADGPRIATRAQAKSSGRLSSTGKVGAKPAMARPVKTNATPARLTMKTPTKRQTDFMQIKQMLIKMLARPPRVEGYQLIVHYEPHSAISRDFYDIIQIDDHHLLLALGDITGHGPGSALMVASTLKSLRLIANSKKHRDLIDIVSALNDDVRPDLMQDCTITMFAALIDTRRRSMTYLCAGHHPAALLNQKRETPMQQIGTQGATLGKATGDDFRRVLRPVTMKLEVGDILLMYSDGLFQVQDARKAEYGRFKFLGSCVANLGRPCNELINQVLEDAKSHAGGRLSEDMTILALRVKEGAQGSDITSFNESWLGKTQMS
ncbi:MAG: serine/threonine-protein phosphatase [Planctomycetes bacterium]|nr:serine/threonine-protein phosphatase [Planctomycetota bacterium]